MNKQIANVIIITSLLIGGFAFAAINVDGVAYAEAMMPVSGHGTDLTRCVVIGDEINISAATISSDNTHIFTINGISYIDDPLRDIPVSEDGRYYIVHRGKNSTSRFMIEGINDWTTQEHSLKDVPFVELGEGSGFYSTAASIDSVLVSNLDFFMINNVRYSNGIITELPERVNGRYYIYYSSTDNTAKLEVKEYLPNLNVKLFVEGGL